MGLSEPSAFPNYVLIAGRPLGITVGHENPGQEEGWSVAKPSFSHGLNTLGPRRSLHSKALKAFGREKPLAHTL